MPFYFIDPEVYRKYRDRVVEMAQSIQVNYVEHLPAEKRKPGFSDEEIAEKLGLDARTVSRSAASPNARCMTWTSGKRRSSSRTASAAAMPTGG